MTEGQKELWREYSIGTLDDGRRIVVETIHHTLTASDRELGCTGSFARFVYFEGQIGFGRSLEMAVGVKLANLANKDGYWLDCADQPGSQRMFRLKDGVLVETSHVRFK